MKVRWLIYVIFYFLVNEILLLIQTDLDCVGPMSYTNVVLTRQTPAWQGIETFCSDLGNKFWNCFPLFGLKAAS